jgi:cysteine-S-conjugate beta-lyase
VNIVDRISNQFSVRYFDIFVVPCGVRQKRVRQQQRSKDMSLLQPAETENMLSIRWDDARKEMGPDAIALSVADMDYRAPKPIVDAVTKRAAIGNYCYTYWDDEYYDSVISWFKQRHNWTVSKDEIIPVGRMVESLPAILRECVGSEANVVVPYPAYSPTPAGIRAADCNVIPWGLKLDEVSGRYEFDFESLPFLLADAKALVITNPHNPTGRVWTKEELEHIAQIAKNAGVLVISDEFHMDLTYSGYDFCPYLTCVGHDEPAISFTSPGKTFNVAGLETANIIVRNPQLREHVRKAIDDAGCHNPRFFAREVTVAGYNQCGPWLDELLKQVQQRFSLLQSTVDSMHGIRLIKAEGTYLAWLDFRATGLDGAQIDRMLKRQKLSLSTLVLNSAMVVVASCASTLLCLLPSSMKR